MGFIKNVTSTTYTILGVDYLQIHQDDLMDLSN